MQATIVFLLTTAVLTCSALRMTTEEQLMREQLSARGEQLMAPTNGSTLTDILKELNQGSRVKRGSGCYATSTYGGWGGYGFNEEPGNCDAQVKTIRMQSGNKVDAIQITWRLADGTDHQGSFHGGFGGGIHEFAVNVSAGEKVIGAIGRSGSEVDQLGLFTNFGRIFGHGGCGGDSFVVNGCEVRGIFGKSGNVVDSIGFHCSAATTEAQNIREQMSTQQMVTMDGISATPTNGSTLTDIMKELNQGLRFERSTNCYATSTYGGGGGDGFNDLGICHKTVKKIIIQSGAVVDAIQLTYRLADGTDYTSPYHGGYGGSYHEFSVDIDNGEKVIGVLGRSGNKVDQLAFITNHGRTFGPHGDCGGDIFAVEGCEVRGIFGRTGNVVDSIGFLCAAV